MAALELDQVDELVHPAGPVEYDLNVQKMEDGLLVEGSLRLALTCECARCLKSYPFQLELDGYATHLALEGEDRVRVENDSVDLTPRVREDILLAFPQHPLCEPECGGLADPAQTSTKNPAERGPGQANPSVWAVLDKLKLNE